jgi:hypothetical protein
MQSINESAKQVPAIAPEVVTVAPSVALGDAKVAAAFIKSNKDGELAAACDRILAAMTGNASYPAPAPTLASLTTAHDAFVAAVQANDGGTKAVVARNQARAALALAMRRLAAYVQHACDGNLLVLLSSGYPAQRQRSVGVVGPLLAPIGVKLRRGNASGQVIARCAQVRSARLYQWRYAIAQAPTMWTIEDTTSTVAYTFTGMIPGTQYLLQVRAFGKRGATDWSDSATLIVT